MKKYLLILISSFGLFTAKAQHVLPVPVVFQEQDQWCWAGCSKCILDYYADTSVAQCEIAEYVRTVATWHSFGGTNCCTSAAMGCNYWNYNWGSPGSIQDILGQFDGIANHGISGALTLAQMDTQAAHYRPFVIRWGWISGGGHFIVGNGVDAAGNVHYMNPWFGEGAHISTYSWMMNDGSHVYTHTNVLDTCPVMPVAGTVSGAAFVLIGGHITLTNTAAGGTWSCTNSHASVSAGGVVTGISAGVDTVMYKVTTPCGTATATRVVTVNAIPSTYANDPGTDAGTMRVYPNPGKGLFTIDIQSLAAVPVDIVITDMVGAKVLSATIMTNKPQVMSLDQPAGVYLLSAATATGRYNAKIVIDR